MLVISPRNFSLHHGDIVVVPLSSIPQEREFQLEKWREAGLLKPTWLKALIATVAESLVEKRLGSLQPDDEAKVASVIGTLIDAKFLGPGYSP